MASSEPIQTIPRVPEKIDFSMEEENILTLWKDLNVFYTCLKQSKGKPMFSFYDGPPFATGLPHYGHILAGTIKDVVTRYMHQHGYNVERRFGWDCHGLPVEYEIDKKLGIMGPEDVIKIGIAEYNKECRKIISRYANEWELVMNRLGRWIDFRNDYKTLYSWFMETVWWIFKQLYDKGMVYRGNKVMPYSTACNTPLSNFESGQNYKVVVDPAVTVTLPIVDDKDGTCLLIWTTTPWTLPSNLAACVHPSLEYARVKQISTNKIFILMEARLVHIFHEGDYEIIEKFPGRKLMNVEYVPIFTYFQEMKVKGAFRVLTDEYVSSESGTGVVHQAPYFGEDDYRICLAAGLITKDEEPICPVDDTGRLTKPVTDFEGQYVKDADKNIISMLKQNGRLFNLSSIKHSYPYCWRSDTPLLYRAVPSWFIRVEFMTEKLQHTCSLTNWVPEFVKEKRFMNWLKEARDWAVSRNRYWGTPIPIWTSPNGDECVCVGSVAELEELTGTKIEDLHRENIDHLEISSKVSGKPPLKRTPEVFDCWFESGSMPYAQQHYPFENVKEFQEAFPADFVAEGIDQTRGWFYTLLVVSTALFGKPPYKNLIASGLILASDGQKMSKRKKNYPDPIEIVSKYGADALRLYLINSPVVRAENLHFKETGVRDIVKDVFLPWYNAFRFLMQNIENYVNLTKESFHYSEAQVWSSNIMDCWILSFTQSLLQHVHKEMGRYHLYNVVPCLTKYIDYLTNWYVRMNRPRLKGNGDKYDCKQALMTLFNVIFLIVKMMSPFSPFLVEYMYQYLKELIDEKSDSIHYLMLPQPNKSLINIKIERSVVRMQSVIELGRIIRDRKMLPMKYPLPEVVVIHQDIEYITDIKSLEHYILDELNVRVLTITIDKSLYGITLRAEPNYKMLGARLKQDFKSIACAIKSLTDSEINNMIRQGFRDFGGHRVELSEVHLSFKLDDIKSRHYEVNSDNDVLILLDCSPDSSMQEEGTAREIINRIQKLRKKAHLVPCDKISVFYDAEGELRRVIDSFSQYIEEKIKATFQTSDKRTVENVLILEDTQKLKDCKFHIILTREVKVEIPVVRWVNVAVLDIKTHYCNGATKGIILLQVDDEIITVDKLRSEIVLLFGIGKNFNIFTANGKMVTEGLGELSGQTLYVSVANDILCQKSCNIPFCKVTNFKHEEICGTLILENPQGVPTKVENNSHAIIQKWITKLSTPVF